MSFTFQAFYPAPETAELVAELFTVEATSEAEAEAMVALHVFGVNTFADGWLELVSC